MSQRPSQMTERKMKPPDDSDLGKQLYDWAVNEMHFQPTGRYINKSPPTAEDFRKICRGSELVKIWTFILGHVRSVQSVKKVQEFIALKKITGRGGYKEQSQLSSQIENLVKRRDKLAEDLTVSLREVGHLESDFKRQESELISTEEEYKKTLARLHDVQRQAGLLDIKSKLDAETAAEYQEFRDRIQDKTDFFTQKTQSDGKIDTLCPSQFTSGDSVIETVCCHEVRRTCEEIESFLQATLYGTFGEVNYSVRNQQESLTGKVDEIVSRFPVTELLQALITNTHSSSVCLRNRTMQINIKQDVEKLKFKHEKGGQLTDVSAPVTLLHSVHQLIEKGQHDHVDKFIETLSHCNAAYRLHREIQQTRKQIDSALKKYFENKPTELKLAKELLENELKLAEERSKISTLVDEGNSLKEEIHKLSIEKEFLVTQYQKIKYFKDLAQKKQNLIQILAKQNAGSKPRLTGQIMEIGKYLTKLSPHHGDTVKLAALLDGTVDAEVSKMAALSLPYLMTVYTDSATKMPVIDLSIHHSSLPVSLSVRPYLQKTLQYLNFPYEKAGECILPHCLEMKTELSEADRLNFELSLNRKKIWPSKGKENEDTVENITELCEKESDYFKKEKAELVPLLQKCVNKVTSALSDTIETKDHIQAWWELPAHNLVPWVTVNGQSYHQLQSRWKIIVTELRQSQIN